MRNPDFAIVFKLLTGHAPFPWQEALYERFTTDDWSEITAIDIPTGLGKTSIMAIWLIALAYARDEDSRLLVPRRLVYVVNRRTVVDQSTREAEKLREALTNPKAPELVDLTDHLREMSAIHYEGNGKGGADTENIPLAISTLRGQFADNQQWSEDPARPAIIAGTVDMIGSRLLFSGYRIGFKSRPLHAGFLGQDALLIHDEAHLEPAFQKLITTIQEEQQRERKQSAKLPWPALRLVQLSATARGEGEAFSIGQADRQHEIVRQRIEATKQLRLHQLGDEKKELANAVSAAALKHEGTDADVLVFLRTVDNVLSVVGKLNKSCDGRVLPLTGTIRGHERDRMAKRDPVFQRFLPEGNRNPAVTPQRGTVYLVCTAAGEVGVNISAHQLACDLTTFDSMAQRFGRVNRFGAGDDTVIDVFHPASFGNDTNRSGFDEKRRLTLQLLKQLHGHGNPQALSNLSAEARQAAFAPAPKTFEATDILFDAWAMTSIREKMPGRPPVAPYLHGESEWEPPQTVVAWRSEVEIIIGDLLERYPPEDLLEAYPLKPHELLKDSSRRVFSELEKLIAAPKKRKGRSDEDWSAAQQKAREKHESPVWIIGDEGISATSMEDLIARGREAIEGATVVLAPSVGGLADGMLDASAPCSGSGEEDIADQWQRTSGEEAYSRARFWGDVPRKAGATRGMRLVRRIDVSSIDEDEIRSWLWYVRPRSSEEAAFTSESKPVPLGDHADDVARLAEEQAAKLHLPKGVHAACRVAALCHDLGKRREVWQRSIGNVQFDESDPATWCAKSGREWTAQNICRTYRHEFGSLLDIIDGQSGGHYAQLRDLSDELQDMALHLIAAHHGRARPHFPESEAYDLNPRPPIAAELAYETPRRYARLQRCFGRWGLAYLESLLRAADYAASAKPKTDTKRSEVT